MGLIYNDVVSIRKLAEKINEAHEILRREQFRYIKGDNELGYLELLEKNEEKPSRAYI